MSVIDSQKVSDEELRSTDRVSELDLDMGDTVRLADTVVVDDDSLHDLLLGTSGTANATGLSILRRLDAAPQRLSTLVDDVAHEHGVDQETAAQAVGTLLHDLDSAARLHVRRSARSWLLPSALWRDISRFAILDPPQRPARRYPMSTSGVVRASCRQAFWPVVILTAVGALITLLVLAQQGSRLSTGQAVAAGGTLPLIAVVHSLLLAVHEWGHVQALRWLGKGNGLVAVRGVRIGVVFPPIDKGTKLVAAAGPIAAMLASLAIAAVGVNISGTPWEILRFAPALGLAHMASLLPWAADGRLLMRRSSA